MTGTPPAFDRSMYRQQLEARTKHSAETQAGGNFKNIYNPAVMTNVKVWKPKEGQHTIDIIPYLAGPFDPCPKTNEGDLTYILDIRVHHGVGPSNDAYVCLKQFGQPCPLCQFIADEMARPGLHPDYVKKLGEMKAKRRGIYNVMVYDNPEEQAKGVQVWNSPHYNMERLLLEQAQDVVPNPNVPGGVIVGGHVSFADPDTGRTVFFKINGTGFNVQYTGHRLIVRGHTIQDATLASAHSLDTLLAIPSEGDLQAVYNFLAAMGGSWAIKNQATPQAQGPAPMAQQDMGFHNQEPLYDAPPAQPAAPAPAPAAPAQAPTPAGGDKCPAAGNGGIFGRHIEQYPECGSCAVYDECAAIFDEARKAAKAARSGQ